MEWQVFGDTSDRKKSIGGVTWGKEGKGVSGTIYGGTLLKDGISFKTWEGYLIGGDLIASKIYGIAVERRR